MNVERKVALCPMDAVASIDDCLKRNQATLRDMPSPPIDVIVLSTTSRPDDPSQTEVTKPDLRNSCSDRSLDADTAECSITTGDSLDFSISSIDRSTKSSSSRRSILRSESRISEPREESSHPRKRKIRFGTIVVRDYGIILGDHPCCSSGPPLTIDWDYHQYEPLDVDVYEFEHALSRRSLREIWMNYYQRKHLLRDYTELEFKAAKKEVKRVQSRRNMSRRLLHIDAVIEKACSKIKKLSLK